MNKIKGGVIPPEERVKTFDEVELGYTREEAIMEANEYLNNGKKIRNVNKLRLMVGYVNKNPYDMFICKTVKKELEFGMKYFKYRLNSIKMRPNDALKMVGLSEEYMDKEPLK